MKFTPTWYKTDFADIPSFQELEDITGTAFDAQGMYIGPKEKPEMQLVLDQRTKRQYWAPKEYDEDAIKYGAAKLEKDFNSKEWWGMIHNPHLTTGQKISTAYIETLKQVGKAIAKAPAEIVAGVTGMIDAVGLDAGGLAKAAFINNPVNLPIYLASSVARKGIKATAEDYVKLLKDVKTPSGQMGETAALYRASAKNWNDTLDKYFPDVDDNVKAHSTLIAIGGMAGQIGGSLLLAAATSSVGGLSAVATAFGSQQFYNIREEYLNKGYSLDSANFFAGLAAISEGGLEAVGFENWLRFATLKPSLRNHLIAGLMEASQEMAQTAGEEIITNVFSNVREETLTEILAQIAISGVAGFVPGAGISMVSGGLGIRQEKAAFELDRAIDNMPIVPQQQTQQTQQATPTQEGQVIKGTDIKAELELAKANKGSNALYEIVRNIANSYGVTEEKKIDVLYAFAQNQAVQGKAGEELLAGLGKQLIAYKNQLLLTNKATDKENREAAADISYHLSQNAVDAFHNRNVKAMKDSGIDERQAEVLAEQQDKIYKNLSEQLGADLQEVKEVKVTAVPTRQEAAQQQAAQAEEIDNYEGEIPFQDRQQEADDEIKALQKQIDELDKLSRAKPKSNLLTTLRRTGVDYANTRLDPQTLKDMGIKNVPVSKGGLGAEGADYLVRHGFMPAVQMNEDLDYRQNFARDGQADEMLERALAGEEIYRVDDQEKIEQADQAKGYKAQLQAELDQLLTAKGKRGYIKIGDILNEIVLGKTSDVTTLQHELMHHWKDVIETMAAKGNKKAQALKAQMDKIIAENKDYVKQDINKEEEVLSEAFEAWLYSGAVAEDQEQQGLFDAIKQYFQDVYDSIKAITGIRINPEIDMFFRQMTGQMPIQMQQENAHDNQADSIYHRTDKSKYMTDNEVKAANEDCEAFKKQFASMLAGKMASADSFTLSRALPSAYNNIPELKGKRLVMSQNVFKKIINLKNKYGKNHNLEYKRAEKLPLYIADPLYITRSKVRGHEDRFVIITGSRGVGNGVRLSVIVQPSKNVVVVSAYDEVVNINEEKKAKRLVYSKKDELLKTNATSKAAPISNSNNNIANQTNNVKAQKVLNQPGYHGSAKKFVYFDLLRIGTGEGAQSHGWGVYIAASQDVAELYRAKLIEREASLAGIDANSFFYNNQHYFMKGDGFYVSNNAASKETEGATKLTREDFREVYLAAVEEDRTARERDKQKGQVYEVEIPENNVLLDEQKKTSKQYAKVKKGLVAALEEAGLGRFVSAVNRGLFNGREVYDMLASSVGSQKAASLLLLKHGIEGITYDGRQDGRCYVIFDDKAVRIQKTFYQTVKAQQTGARAADEQPSKEQIAKDLNVIRNNGVEKYTPKSRLGDSLGNWAKHILLSVRQRAGAIDPKIKAFFDKLDYFQPNLEKKFASKANGFIKKFQKLTEEEKNEFDYYVYNKCHEELETFVKAKGLAQDYQDVRQLLNFIYAIGNQAGIDMGFIEEYFPTSMIDYAGFLDYLKGTDKWSYISQALHEADPQGVWSDKEKAEAVNKLLRGYSIDPAHKPGNAKERKILYKSPELMKFYEHSDVALIKYLQGMSQAIAINKAFGKGGGFNTDETIGAIVVDLINSGTITHKEEQEIKRLLKSRLSYGATPEFIAMVKNIGYLQTMNNFTSAITQLGDLYAPFYKYSFGTALQSIFGKTEITKTDLGLDAIWEEMSDKSKTGIAVDKLFKAVGLEALDGFGKNVAINASYLNLKKQAANNSVDLLNRLAYTFGKDAQRVLADIKAGKINDDVKILIWADLADTQPIGRSGVPTGYLENPHGRLFYQLKTFSLNQISLFYADCLLNIQKGIKYKNKAQFLKGVQNSFKLLLLLTAGNAAADVLKNLVMGREIDITDTVVSNLLWNVGVSKYTFYKGKRDGYVRSILSSYLMPPQVSSFDDMQLDIRRIATGKRKLKDTAAVTYLPFGRAYYWWFGGGRTAEQERAAKERKAKRTKRKNKNTKGANK